LLLRRALRRKQFAPIPHHSHEYRALHQQAREINPVILEPIRDFRHKLAFEWSPKIYRPAIRRETGSTANFRPPAISSPA
jgi:hypothetical protein